MADDRLDGGAALHFAADGSGDAPDLAADPDPELVRMVVAAIALIDVGTARLDASELLHVGNHRTKRVAVERIAVEGLGMQHEVAAFG